MNLKHRLRKRLVNTGVSRADARRWSDRVQSQINHMGPEGAVSYLKRIGDCIIWGLTGSGDKPVWVKTRHRYPQLLAGIESYSEAIKLRVAKLARTIVLNEITPTQVDKVVGAVLSPHSREDHGLDQAYYYVKRGMEVLDLYAQKPDMTDFPLVMRQFRRVQSLSGKTGLVSEPPFLDSIRILADMPVFREVPNWEKVLYPLHPDWLNRNIEKFQSSWPLNHVGEIHASQEGGGKLRMFASPYTVIQCLLYPVHYFMDHFRVQLVTDCNSKQPEGALFAQASLLQGKNVHSVDLSTATCRFPWELQEALCRDLGLQEEFLTAFRFVAKGKWKVGKELRKAFSRKSLSWEVGQPLGIAPSMSTFSLTHNLLLTGICLDLGRDPSETFRVLGDDVIITDDSVHQLYLRVMSELGVPISWHKSHSSNSFAEFAGYAVTHSSLIRAGQWKPVDWENALDLALELGTPLYGECPPRVILAQKLALFREDKYTPGTPAELEVLTKASSVLEEKILKWMKSNSDFWYYTCLNKMQSHIRAFLHTAESIPFVPETPSCSSLKLSHDDADPVVIETCNSKIPGLTYIRSHPTFCYSGIRATLDHFRDIEVLPPTVYRELVDQLHKKANTLLYQPPSDRFHRGSPLLKAHLSALDVGVSQPSTLVVK